MKDAKSYRVSPHITSVLSLSKPGFFLHQMENFIILFLFLIHHYMSGVCGRGKGGTVTVFCLQVTGLADLTGGSALSVGLI